MASEGKRMLVQIYNEKVAQSDKLWPFNAAKDQHGDLGGKKRKKNKSGRNKGR